MAVTKLSTDILKTLAKRQQDAHKGSFGNVVVVGGDYGMPGAARIAAEAALRVGAGLVTVLTRKEHVAPVVSGRPELLCYGVEESDSVIDKVLARATVVVLGPGLGQSSWSKYLYDKVLALAVPKVVDADALNLLAADDASRQATSWVLTPHPGEAGRLLNLSIQDVQSAREDSIKALQLKYGGTIVLKGHGTLITADGKDIKMCAYGNPGMATAGMGDLLSGVIAGLLAQGLDSLKAAQLGVLRHAMAGDKVIAKTGKVSALAMDLLGEV